MCAEEEGRKQKKELEASKYDEVDVLTSSALPSSTLSSSSPQTQTSKKKEKNPPPPTSPHYLGHRERLRCRFMKSPYDFVVDYELMELILFRAIPRRDVKPLAKKLINKFGSFSEALSAPDERLKEVKNVTDSVVIEFRIIQISAHKLLKAKTTNRPIFSNWENIIHYCTATMAYNATEQFRILFLDKKDILIADEVQQKGTVDHTPVYTREIIKRTLDLQASAIILVHNHPSGDPTPSSEDLHMTNSIVKIAQSLNIRVHDHIIIGKDRHTSFREIGFIS